MDRQKLVQVGINYDEGVHRFTGKPQVYEKFLLKFFEQNEMSQLKQALDDRDFNAAFSLAHTIKGNSGNLSITAFYNKICELVDTLRAGVQDESLLIIFTEAENLYNTARKAVEGDING